MDNSPSPYLRKISLIVKTGTTFSFRGQLNYPILLLVTLACSVVILSDFVGSQERGIQHAFLHGRVYEAPILIFLILNIPILILKRANISELIELLLEPFDEVSFGKESIKAAKHFFKWINIIGTIVIFNNFFLFACCIMVLGPLCTLPFYPADTTIQDLPLPMGMIPFHKDSYFVYAAFYITSSFSIFGSLRFPLFLVSPFGLLLAQNQSPTEDACQHHWHVGRGGGDTQHGSHWNSSVLQASHQSRRYAHWMYRRDLRWSNLWACENHEVSKTFWMLLLCHDERIMH